MAVFRCKMCGGELNVSEGMTVCECAYCGTKQTLPKLDDDKKANLYDRANHFRRNNEYDKAMSIYNNILNEDTSDAEAYWSLVLCKYGIEYVEDPASHKRIPTVNRTQFTSIFADEDYKQAIQYADGYQKDVYEAEAKAIDEIQKGILEISNKEDPFDVFICYKETDNQGRRTPDSVLATELYHELTKEGFKVFFSRITLEDKLGTAYEPYIFAALNSSKVMVALGTKAEYFNSVWVKNEWSRYLSLIKNGAKKTLIPAYRDMDPYDLPEEFSHLQAQDMSKLGFMQDLIRGIGKILSVEKPTSTETVVINNGNASVEPLLKRAFMFLEDKDWNSANEYCEKVLDQDPENAMAYLGKLMAELKVSKQEKLADCKEPFTISNNYKKAVRFADSKLAEILTGYISHIIERNEQEETKEKYFNAVYLMESAKSEEDFKRVSELFDDLKNYKDSNQLKKDCLKKFEELQLKNKQNAEEKRVYLENKKKSLMKIVVSLVSITAFCVIVVILLNILIIPNAKYSEAVNLYNNKQYANAYDIFSELGDYKDAKKYSDEIVVENSKELFNSINVGDTFRFGIYQGESLEWRVLEKSNDKILLLTENLIDCKKYNTENISITWESCSLRKWLNNDFINKSFNEIEKGRIIETKIKNLDNNEYNIDGGNDTIDKIFLLSYNEAEKYFAKQEDRIAIGTKYANKNNLAHAENGDWWWLRSPGENSKEAMFIYGTVYSSFPVDEGWFMGIRPAMWIDINE